MWPDNINELVLNWVVKYGSRIILALLLLIIGKWLIKILTKYVDKWSAKKLDPTLQTFMRSITRVLLMILLFITVASTIGLEMTSFIAVFGAAGLAIGLALQGSLANFAGGILILTFRPFNTGDFIEVGNFKGKVKEISILYTTLLTRDNKRIYIPNGEVANNSLINYSTEETRRVELVFSAGYDDDLIKVKELLKGIVEEHELILKEPDPVIRVGEHAGSSINYNVFVWTRSENYWDVYYDLLEEVKIVFDREGISIPYPQLDVHFDEQDNTLVNERSS